jgi:predicted glutamine amidotransferase
MCRWLAYTGSPVLIEDLLYRPEHSLIVQSMHSTMGAEATNGDGFGLGWYADRPTPGVFRAPSPRGTTATSRDLAAHISSRLALTFGLESDPREAVSRAVGLIEELGRRHGVPFPVQMTVATTDGESFYGFRYSSEGRSRSLFHSNDVSTLREQYPDNPLLREISSDARLVVSEPRGGLRGAWREVPESTCVLIQEGRQEVLPFAPWPPGRVA